MELSEKMLRKQMKKSWFAVKTLYYQEAKGRAKSKDKYFLKSSVTLEERIVIFFTDGPQKAIKLAEKDARKYAKRVYENPYGEIIHTIYSGYYDAIELFDPPGHGIEIFGIIDLYLSKNDMKQAMKIKAGKTHGKNERNLRKRFQHR